MMPVNVDRYNGDPSALTWVFDGVGSKRDGSLVLAQFRGYQDPGCGFPTTRAYAVANNVEAFAKGAEPEGTLSLLPTETIQEMRIQTRKALESY